MKFIAPDDDPSSAGWGGAGPAACSLLTLEQWQAVRHRWPAMPRIGVSVPNDTDITVLEPDLPRLSLVVLQFPKWTDGRAYTQARLLRTRLRFKGEVRASGEVLVDMLPLLQRTGFDAVQLRGDQCQEAAQRALHYFAGHYQGDTLEPWLAYPRDPSPPGRPKATTPPLGAGAEGSGGANRGRAMSAISLYARQRDGYAERLAHTLELLQRATADHAGAVVQATSLGAEDMVITDLIAGHGLAIALATLDTGLLHPQTLALIPAIEQRYGLPVQRYRPLGETVVEFVRSHGERAMYKSTALRQACCGVRKLEPLARLLAGRNAWVTGLRREQSAGRVAVPFSETDAPGRTKLNPLADWSWADVWFYLQTNEVPYNALHDAFFPSIGCAPCTRAVALGEDPRSGRWWWEQEGAKECGLHLKQETVSA